MDTQKISNDVSLQWVKDFIGTSGFFLLRDDNFKSAWIEYVSGLNPRPLEKFVLDKYNWELYV